MIWEPTPLPSPKQRPRLDTSDTPGLAVGNIEAGGV